MIHFFSIYLKLSLLFLPFFIYSVLGWCSEVLYCSFLQKTFINRGFLTGPYCPIYGAGAMVSILLITPFMADPVLVFFLGMFLTSLLEYVTGWAMESLFHAKWWDYSDRKFNIKGRVCLKNSTFFGVMALGMVYFINPVVEGWIALLSFGQIIISATCLSALLTADLIVSTFETVHLTNKVLEIEAKAGELAGELRSRGLETREAMLLRLEDTHKTMETLRSNADESFDELEARMNAFAKGLAEEKGRHRYAHRRIIKAFPEFEFKGSPKTISFYRSAMRRNNALKKLQKKYRNDHDSQPSIR